MIKFFINIAFTDNPDTISFTMDEKGSKTKFLSFCMHATGVRRLFDKRTTKEFLWRLAIVFRHYDIVDKFFTDDSLVSYDDRGVKNELCLSDVIEHLGLELWDRPYDMVTREEWRSKIEVYWLNACRIAVFTGLPILDKRIIGRNKFIIGSNKPKPVTNEFEKTAELFACEALNTIGDKVFADLSKRIIDRKKYLAQFELRLAVKPKHTFNFQAISLKLRRRIYSELFQGVKITKQVLAEEINNPESMFGALVHLGWLWINGYIKETKIVRGDGKSTHFAEVDERLTFDYGKYEGLNSLEFGVNLYDTYYDLGVDKVSYLLREKR